MPQNKAFMGVHNLRNQSINRLDGGRGVFQCVSSAVSQLIGQMGEAPKVSAAVNIIHQAASEIRHISGGPSNFKKLVGGNWLPWILFSHQWLGFMSSSQLTKSYIFQRGGKKKKTPTS